MKIVQISVTISQSISVAKYEAIKPSVTLTAEVDQDKDDIEKCANELHKMGSKLWARNALKELSWVADRRDRDQKHEFTQTTANTRTQIKGMLK